MDEDERGLIAEFAQLQAAWWAWRPRMPLGPMEQIIWDTANARAWEIRWALEARGYRRIGTAPVRWER